MKKYVALTGLFLVVCFLPTYTFGQAVYGSIFGTVTDQSGAAVPNAKVTVTNLRKGTKDEVTTNEAGNYSATHLIPDSYALHVEATGFKVIEQKPITVAADTASRVDARLEVGTVTEAVEVTAEAPQLKTDRADVAISFDQRGVQELPLLNRNFTSLELSAPGTQRLVGWSHAATENPQGSQQIFVNGQHFSGTAYELDGTDNQDPILGIIVINPNLESVTETKMTLQNYDAEFGKAIAGVMTAQTRSGSNTLHGSGFWFRRSDATQARDPFTQFQKFPLTGRFIPTTMWNQFGGSLGGAVIKDKLFFFGDYQGTRRKTGRTIKATVPTRLVHDTCLQPTGFCDLSDYLGNVGTGNGTIYDPATGTPTTGTGGVRTQFPGNLIPNDRISPQARAILRLLPLPNAAGTNNGVLNNFVGAGSGPFNDNGFNTRIDFQATSNMHVFGRYSYVQFSLSGQPIFGPEIGGEGFGEGGLAGSATTHNHSLATGFDKVISPTLLTDVRFGYFKYHPESNKYDVGTTPANDFGIGSATGNLLNTGDKTTSGLPAFYLINADGNDGTISNFGEALNITRCNCPLVESEQQFQFVNNWTKMSGNHQFKFGGDVRYAMNLRLPSDSNRTGQLNFNRKNTSQDGTNGLDLATFLLGNVTFMDRYVNNEGTIGAAERQKRFFYYGQDTWRITPKLTVNYGLRWEMYFPESVNGKGKGGFANLEEGLIRVAGFGPYGTNGNIDMKYTAFAPRLGIAYELNPKTVVRLGYGRSFDIGVFGSLFGHTVTQNLPVLVNQNVSATANGLPNASNHYIGAFTLASGPPVFPFPDVPDSGQLPLKGQLGNVNPKARPTFMRLPTLDAWNLTVQHQFTNTISGEVAYVANHGTHVFAGNGPGHPANSPSIIGFAQGVPQAQRRPLFNRFSYPGYIDPATGTTLRCCSDDVDILGNDASNNYNALQVKFTKRFAQGLQFMAHYTWAKALNYTDTYFVNDSHIAYGPDDYTRTHAFVTDVLWELPFGRGHAFAANASGALNKIIGGWQISSITNWSGGLPWTPSYSDCGSDKDTGPCRPDRVGSFAIGAGSLDPVTHQVTFFTPVSELAVNGQSAGGWQRPLKGQFGSAGRNSMRGPGLFTSDMSLLKNIPISERVNAQFRVDAFNVFNHPVLGFNTDQGNKCIDCGGDAGKITALQGGTTMRQLQFGLKFSF